jgi:integrase
VAKPKAVLLPGLSSRLDGYFARVAGDAFNEFEGAARAGNTWRQYSSTVTLFKAYCAEVGAQPLPALPETVKQWVLRLARAQYASSTIDAYVAGLCTWHKLHGHELDRRPLAQTLKGIRRTAEPKRRVRPLLRAELAGILDMLDQTKPRDVRDGALLAVGWANAMRRSEVVGLDWQQRRSPSRGTGVVRLTPEGISVELYRSKTMQETVVQMADIPKALMPAASTWLERWAAVAELRPGDPVFRRVVPSAGGVQLVGVERLSDHRAAMIIKARVVALEVARGADRDDAVARAEQFSGHSLRSGYVTSAARAGVPEYLIRQRSRHKSAQIVADYVRAEETEEEHGLRKVGL